MILVMGGTQGVGLAAVNEALSRGLRVRAMARGAGDLPPDAPGLEHFAGDALDPEDVARALSGVDTVIFALGIKESVAMLWQEVTLFFTATRLLLPAMEAEGTGRLLVVTGFGAGRSKSAMSLPERLGHRAILGKPYDDKDLQEAMVEASPLDWTIVRPVILTNGQRTGRVRVMRDPEEWRNGLISRADVAVYLLDAATQGLDIRRDVVIARG